MATNITVITDSANSAGTKGARQFQGLFEAIPFKFTIDDDSLAAQVAGQCDIAVPGAELGDFVLIAPSVDHGPQIMFAAVTATDVVTLTTFNVEGTDASTAFATASVVNGLVLKPRDGVWAAL